MTGYLVAGGCAVLVLALLVWPRKPPPVVGGTLLPFPDRKKRKPFTSNRSA